MRAALKGQAAWRNPYTEAKVNAPSNAKTNQRLPSYHPDDRRDYDGPAGDDSERTLVSHWLDDLLYLPETMYIIILIWLICSGPGRVSVNDRTARALGYHDGGN